jgi:hypothetical protein
MEQPENISTRQWGDLVKKATDNQVKKNKLDEDIEAAREAWENASESKKLQKLKALQRLVFQIPLVVVSLFWSAFVLT